MGRSGQLVGPCWLAAGGEAHLKRFGPGSSDDDFEAYLFNRENPKGVHFERWRHINGCGKWFNADVGTVASYKGPDWRVMAGAQGCNAEVGTVASDQALSW